MPEDVSAYEDDPTIADDTELSRRIPPVYLVDDDNRGGKRISSAAFCDHQNGSPMSVVLGQEVLNAGRDPQSVLAGHQGFYLASVTAGLARSLKQAIARRPVPEEPAHAEVFGKKTKSVKRKRKLAKAATWIIGPVAGD